MKSGVMYCYHRIERWKGIGKIIKIDGDYIHICFKSELGIYTKNNVVASPNIIDLIEENDYINGLRVEKNKYGELYTSYVYYGGDIGKMCEVYTTWLKEYKEDEIYSIVTKEQFSQMEYKVVE